MNVTHQMIGRRSVRGRPVFDVKCGKAITGERDQPMRLAGVVVFHPTCPDCMAVTAEYHERKATT